MKNTNLDKPISIDRAYVRKKFREYNELYFNNELKMPCIRLIHSTCHVGEFSCRRNHTTGVLYNIVIGIAENVLWTEREFRGTLVHEMIHYYVYTKEKDPWGGDLQHIGLFWRMKVKLNWKYGLGITNTAKDVKFLDT